MFLYSYTLQHWSSQYIQPLALPGLQLIYKGGVLLSLFVPGSLGLGRRLPAQRPYSAPLTVQRRLELPGALLGRPGARPLRLQGPLERRHLLCA